MLDKQATQQQDKRTLSEVGMRRDHQDVKNLAVYLDLIIQEGKKN